MPEMTTRLLLVIHESSRELLPIGVRALGGGSHGLAAVRDDCASGGLIGAARFVALVGKGVGVHLFYGNLVIWGIASDADFFAIVLDGVAGINCRPVSLLPC